MVVDIYGVAPQSDKYKYVVFYLCSEVFKLSGENNLRELGVPFGMRFISNDCDGATPIMGKYNTLEQVTNFEGNADDITRYLTTYRGTSSKGKKDDEVPMD